MISRLAPGRRPWEGIRDVQSIAWLSSVALCVASLILSSRYRAGLVLKLAIGSILGGMLLVTVLGLALRELRIRPSDQFTATLFQLLLTVLVIAMLNIANLAFRAILHAQRAFHQRYNAGNIDRFPVSLVIGKAAFLGKFGICFWGMGSTLMLYGVWFEMKI
jgi:hypothetical protein